MNPHDNSILIVDDNPVTSEILYTFLTEQGYRVEALADSREVQAFLHANPIDLVLMDIMMPHLSGIELCRELKADAELADIPIIFVTTSNHPQTLTEAFRAGGVDYLTNPYIYEELLARIDTHLRLRRSERQLRNQLEMRELMLTTLAHDLRGPVGTSAVILERVLTSPTPLDDRRPVLESTAFSIRKTYQLLEDMLSWAQALHHALPFRPEWVALPELVQASFDQCQLQARDKHIRLKMEVGLDARHYLDPNLVRSILVNLLGNAIKFSPAESVVTLKSRADDARLALEVHDTGLGMPPELIARLEQQMPVKGRKGTAGELGSGMGLKISQAFADRHGAELKIASRLGEGSCFSLVIPKGEEGA